MGGVAKPLSLFVETYGTERENLTPDARTQVPGDSGILPLWPGALHKGRHEVLRVGERKELVQVRDNDISGGLGRAEKQQLPDEVGGLSNKITLQVSLCSTMGDAKL